MTVETFEKQAIVRAVVKSSEADRLVLGIPHTSYQLHLNVQSETKIEPGAKIKGSIHAKALKIHPAEGGGLFIEPVNGEPRIMAGRVMFMDEEARRALVDVCIPVWVEVQEEQDLGICRVGELVNFYVASGTSFQPIGD